MKTKISLVAIVASLTISALSSATVIDDFESYTNGLMPNSNALGSWSMLNNPAGSTSVVTSSGFPSTPNPDQTLQFRTGDNGGKDLEFDFTNDIMTKGNGPLTLSFLWLAVEAADGGTGVGMTVRPLSGDGAGANDFPFQFSTLATSSTLLMSDGLGNNQFFVDANGANATYSIGNWYETTITMEQDLTCQWTVSADVVDFATNALVGSVSSFAGKNFALDRLDGLQVSSSSNPNQRFQIDNIQIDPIPEPGAAVLLMIGGLSLLALRKN